MSLFRMLQWISCMISCCSLRQQITWRRSGVEFIYLNISLLLWGTLFSNITPKIPIPKQDPETNWPLPKSFFRAQFRIHLNSTYHRLLFQLSLSKFIWRRWWRWHFFLWQSRDWSPPQGNRRLALNSLRFSSYDVHPLHGGMHQETNINLQTEVLCLSPLVL